MNIPLDEDALAAAGITHTDGNNHHTFSIADWTAPVQAFSGPLGLNVVPARDAGHRRLLAALGIPWSG